MKRINNKGFMLAETLVVSTVLMIIFTYVYIQFFDVLGKYSIFSDYDNVDKLYTVRDIKEFVKSDNISGLVTQLNANLAQPTPQPYVDVTDCSVFTESNYCLDLFEKLDIEKIVFTTYDLTDSFNGFSGVTHDLDRRFQTYVNTLTANLSEDYVDEYRLIIKFEDGTYSTGRINEFEDIDKEEAWGDWISMGNTSSVEYVSELYFDGIDDYINLGNPSSLSVTKDFTVHVRVKPNAIGQTIYI